MIAIPRIVFWTNFKFHSRTYRNGHVIKHLVSMETTHVLPEEFWFSLQSYHIAEFSTLGHLDVINSCF